MLNRLQDVFRSFQQHDVRYVVIGGIASILHGVPRDTFDLDILIEATPENAHSLSRKLFLFASSRNIPWRLIPRAITCCKAPGESIRDLRGIPAEYQMRTFFV
jgi:hypothetical protein